MLGILVEEPFSDPEWLFEPKLDGERVLCLGGRRGVQLLSRNGMDLSVCYPELVQAFEEMSAAAWRGPSTSAGSPPAWVADGEVVALEDGLPSFSRLQKRIHLDDPHGALESSVAVYYYVFDLLSLGGQDFTALPLRTRKALLRDAFEYVDPIRLSPHRNGEGEAYYGKACRSGWEGIMAKRSDSPYHHGRSSDWRKLKCVPRQELIVGGYSEPKGSRPGFGSLLVGYYEEQGLRYAGKVGTGFDRTTLRGLKQRLKRAERKTPPFCRRDLGDLPKQGVRWVTPKFVAEVGFSEWTTAGRVRHSRYLGMRRDKNPREVTRELPQ